MNNKKHIFIIAEMAWSHDGSAEKAKKIIKGASDAGADAISFHITHMEDYMVQDYGCSVGQVIKQGKKKVKMYDYLQKLNLKDADWKELFPYARKLGLKICAMPNDGRSLKLCKKLNPDIYVIPPACFVEEDFMTEVAKEKKPVILRVGGASLPEIKRAIYLIKKYNKKEITLLHGIQSYPTKIEDTNLNLIPALMKTFKFPVGIADHINAESEMAYIIPLIAIPMGATLIEKHLTHNRALRGVDYIAALNPDEFKKFVGDIKETEKALGISYFKKLSKAEEKYRKVVRKRTVAAKDIKAGEKITKNSVVFKRADEGLYPDEIKKFFGKKTKYNIKRDEPIFKNKLK